MVEKVYSIDREDLSSTSRRGFLRVAGVTALGGAIGYSMPLDGVAGKGPIAEALAQDAKPLPEYVKWKDAEALIIHSDTTIETKREAFGTSLITPAERLYIRNNVKPPSERSSRIGTLGRSNSKESRIQPR